MGAPNVGPAGVTVYSPTARHTLSKVGKLEVADAGTAFAAFGLPSGALVLGVYIIATGANATQTINVGFTAGGTDLVNAFAPNATGYTTPGAQTGSAVGTVVSGDKTVYLRASATLTTPVVVKVEYYIPPAGQAF
jgi:hypothetical protein